MNVHTLHSIIDDVPDFASAWEGCYKIPWDDPEFSRRMLREHLSQQHDLASRKQETIDRQIEWIAAYLGTQRPMRILDLGCGPGLYAAGLIRMGHDYHGIDFSPASIDYARQQMAGQSRCRFTQGDLRSRDFEGEYDLIMMLFGEWNVFSPKVSQALAERIHASLAPEGRLLIELQKAEVVQASGTSANTWYKCPSGLFSDRPHLCLTENHWDQQRQIALQLFYVIDAETAHVARYRSTTQAWPEEAFRELLARTGFGQIEPHANWPQADDNLMLWSARK